MRVYQSLALILFGLCKAFTAYGAASSFPEHNFAIEIPDSWVAINPRPPIAVIAVQLPDASKKLVVTTNKIPDDEKANAGLNLRAGIKDTMTAQGWKFEAEQRLESGGLPFVRLSARRASTNHCMV